MGQKGTISECFRGSERSSELTTFCKKIQGIASYFLIS